MGTAQADGNVTGAADTLVGLTTLFFALAIATSSIGIAAQGDSKNLKPLQREIFVDKPNIGSTSLRGQDRGVKHKNYAVETDKAYFTFFKKDESKIYSPTLSYI